MPCVNTTDLVHTGTRKNGKTQGRTDNQQLRRY